MNEQSNYLKYRGKCKEYSEKLCQENPDLRLVRGYYYDTSWGRQEHWWCEDSNGKVIDPTKKQFPSCGLGEYEEFNGWLNCESCKKSMKEEDAQFAGRFPICSNQCYAELVL